MLDLHSLARVLGASALALLAGACASGGGGKGSASDAPPESFEGFTSQAELDIVIAEARFYSNHDDVFGDDLIDEDGVIPVALRIGLKGEGQEGRRIRIAPSEMDLRLYLQDGTCLSPVAVDQVAKGSRKVSDRVTQLALKQTWLERWDATKEAFVFFRLNPRGDFSVDGTDVRHKQGAIVRSLDLSKSLLAFQVTMERGLVPFHVGLQRDVHAGR